MAYAAESWDKEKGLVEMEKISDSTIRKLNHNENVTVEILGRICPALGCSLDDICEVIPETEG